MGVKQHGIDYSRWDNIVDSDDEEPGPHMFVAPVPLDPALLADGGNVAHEDFVPTKGSSKGKDHNCHKGSQSRDHSTEHDDLDPESKRVSHGFPSGTFNMLTAFPALRFLTLGKSRGKGKP